MLRSKTKQILQKIYLVVKGFSRHIRDERMFLGQAMQTDFSMVFGNLSDLSRNPIFFSMICFPIICRSVKAVFQKVLKHRATIDETFVFPVRYLQTISLWFECLFLAEEHFTDDSKTPT
ncbi:hypothetical protein CEXT_652471 [Caerostris extrusa]|uniref:Uncharacterized protein n=1 Tax=Caerostris extrusa TaxID=172846 RepID=A0AAV4Y6X2_CAEEX|nr:hypothetical protein CEXT_652471 [Caerostris extrusa]